MRYLNKVIVFLLTITILFSTTNNTLHAAEKTSAEKLNSLGLLLNISDTELKSELTREIGLSMILKALGYTQANADAVANRTPFKDTTGWFKGWAVLAFDAGITAGTTSTTFSPKDSLTEKQFVAFMLRALGYGTSVAYNNAPQLGASAGLVPLGSTLSAKVLTKFVASEVMFNALKAQMQNASGTLADKLIADGRFTLSQALVVGIKTEIAIDCVVVNNLKTMTVTFNQPVNTSVTSFKVKKGTIVYNVTAAWNVTKNTATLSSVITLPDGSYTLEISGLTSNILDKAFTVNSAGITNIAITSTEVGLINGAQIVFKVSNQYGQVLSVDGSAVIATAYNTTQKRIEVISDLSGTNESKLKLDTLGSNGAKLGDVIRITIAYQGNVIQANLKVIEPAASSSLTFGEAIPLTNKTRITTFESGLIIPYTLYDQYGNLVKLKYHSANSDISNDLETIDNIMFTSSDPTIVDVDRLTVDSSGNLKFTAGGKAGKAIITAIINSSGAIATLEVDVFAPTMVDTLVIADPTIVIAAGETILLPLTAVDQYGILISTASISGLTFTSSNVSVIANNKITISNGKLSIFTTNAGWTNIIAKNANGVIIGSITLVVEEKAVPFQIIKVNFPSIFEANVFAAKRIIFKDLEVIDQYGRPYDLSVHNEQIDVVAKDGTPTILNIDTGSFHDTGMVITGTETADSEVYTFSIHDVPSSPIDVTFKTIATNDIKNYYLESLPVLYIGSAYRREIELLGKTSTEEGIVLSQTKVSIATSSLANVAIVSKSNNKLMITGIGEGTTVITAWNGATKLAEATATVSKVVPYVATLRFSNTVATSISVGESVNLKTYLEVLDQYGFPINDVGHWSSSITSNATITGSTGIITGVAIGQVTISYVTSTGIIITTVIDVQ